MRQSRLTLSPEKQAVKRQEAVDGMRQSRLTLSPEKQAVKRQEAVDGMRQSRLTFSPEKQVVKRQEAVDGMKQSRLTFSPEKKASLKQQDTQRKRDTRQQWPDKMKDFKKNPLHSVLRFWSLGENVGIPSNASESEVDEIVDRVLQPITPEETARHIRSFHDDMDPNSFMYGCAACGILEIPFSEDMTSRRVGVPEYLRLQPMFRPPLQKLVLYLELFGISSSQTFRTKTVTEDGRVFALYPQFLASEGPVNMDSIVLLCKTCGEGFIHKRVPKCTLMKGVDYGCTVSKTLPKLSLLGVLLIQKVRIYSHIVKMCDGLKRVALNGHVIAVGTKSADQISLECSSYVNTSQRMSLPRSEMKDELTVMFIGSFDRWNRILERRVGEELELVHVYRHIFSVPYHDIMIWLRFLIDHCPSYRDIFLDESPEVKSFIEGLPSKILNDTHVSMEDMTAGLDEFSKTNHPNAPSGTDEVRVGTGDDEEVYGHLSHVVLECDTRSGGVDIKDGSEKDILNKVHDLLKGLSKSELDEDGHVVDEDHKSGINRPRVDLGHDKDLMSEIDHLDVIMEGGFPCLFLFGFPFKDSSERCGSQEIEHMLLQADNRFADNTEFIFYWFNNRGRLESCKGVHITWRTGSSLLNKLQQFLNEDGYLSQLKSAADLPHSPNAKRILRIILPLINIAGKTVPYGRTGSSHEAFSQMLNSGRFFSNLGWFFTANPVMHDYPLALRIGCAGSTTLLNNWSDPTGHNFTVSDEVEGRRRVIDQHPLGAVLGYMRFVTSLTTHVLGAPLPRPGDIIRRTPQVPGVLPDGQHEMFVRKRGCLGPISSWFVAQEVSKSLSQHMHGIFYSKFDWTFLRRIADNPLYNLTFGTYLDSIQCSGLSDEDWLRNTVAEGDGTKHTPWISPTLQSRCPPVPSDVGLFEMYRGYILSHKQDHNPHNHSCWKKVKEIKNKSDSKSEEGKVSDECTKCSSHYADGKCRCNQCRFRYPQGCWDKQSGLVQLVLKKTVKIVSKTDSKKTPSGVRRQVFARLNPVKINAGSGRDNDIFEEDGRFLYPVQYRPSSSLQPMISHRECADLQEKDPFLLDVDGSLMGRNGMFTNCAPTVSVASGCQNDVQLTLSQGLGGYSYTTKYVSKGLESKLCHTLSLFYEAVTVSKQRPSVAADVSTNPLRGAMRILTRLINNKVKSVEYPIRLCLSSLLGLKQFTSSHPYQFVFVRAARGDIIQQLKYICAAESDLPDTSFWEHAAVTEEHSGTGVNDPSGIESVVFVTQYVDYRHRPVDLKLLSLLEFACCSKKEPRKKRTSNDTSVIDSEITDSEDCHKGIFFFRDSHPQALSHKLVLNDMVKVPLLAGEYAPTLPSKVRASSLPLDLTKLRDHQSRLDDFGSYFLTLLCPCDLGTGVPPYALTWDGFIKWWYSFEDGNQSSVENMDWPRENMFEIHKARQRYVRNCVHTAESDPSYHLASELWRSRKTTTFEEYEKARTAGRSTGTSNFSDQRVNSNRGEIYNEKDLVEAVANLRCRFEDHLLNEKSKTTALQEERDISILESLGDLFGVTRLSDEDNVVKNPLSLTESPCTPLVRHSVPVNVLGSYVISSTVEMSNDKLLEHTRLLQMAVKGGDSEDIHVHPHGVSLSLRSSTYSKQSLLQPRYLVAKLNRQQKSLYEKFTFDNRSKSGQLLELWLGMPGTGKTYLANCIRHVKEPGEVFFCAPTGKAAVLVDGCTLHALFGLGMQQDSESRLDRIPKMSDVKLAQLRLKLGSLKILVIDEVSMMVANTLDLISQRLQQVFRDRLDGNLPFGGVDVILLGDFLQLAPVGGISLLSAALLQTESNSVIPVTDLIRKFKLTMLTEQMRASEDPAHMRMLSHLSNVRAFPKPLNAEMFRESCEHCHGLDGVRVADPVEYKESDSSTHHAEGPFCPALCPHRCNHFKVLNVNDIQQDPKGWAHCKLACAMNSTVWLYTVKQMTTLASETGQPILRWRLPPKLCRGGQNLNPVISDEEADVYGPDLWSYFVQGAPVTIDHNANTEVGIANGVQGTLHSVVLTNDQKIFLNDLIETGLAVGTVVTLSSPPLSVNITIPTVDNLVVKSVIDCHITQSLGVSNRSQTGTVITMMCDVPNPHAKLRPREKVRKLARDYEGVLKYHLIEAGYKFDFASTIYGVQGATIPKLLVDINWNPKFTTGVSLTALYVLISRVQKKSNLRLVPCV